MADTVSDSLQITDQTTGGNDDTWGNIQDANNTKLETGIAGLLDLTGLTGGTTALTDDQNRNAILQCSGTLASNQIITVNAAAKWWHVVNNTTGSYTLTIKTSAGSGVTVPQSGSSMIYCDGTDIITLQDTDVIAGMGTVTDNRLMKTDGTAGNAIQQTGITVDDSDNVTGVGTLAATGQIDVAGDAAGPGAINLYEDTDNGTNKAEIVPPASLAANISVTLPGFDVVFPAADGTAGQYVQTDGAGNLSFATPDVPLPFFGGYLTTQSGQAAITADQEGVSAIYYTLDKGNKLPLYDGTEVGHVDFTNNLQLDLVSAHLANTAYDIWAFSDGGTLRLATGPAWTNSGAGSGNRGSGASSSEVEWVNGLQINAVSFTGRNGAATYSIAANRATLLGSVLIDGTAGQVTCHRTYGQNRKFSLYNLRNQKEIILRAGDTANASWSYGSATPRQSNADSGNVAKAFTGMADGQIKVMFNQLFALSGGGGSAAGGIAIGVNSTSTGTGNEGNRFVSGSDTVRSPATAREIIAPTLGLTEVYPLEIGNSLGVNFFGTEDDMLLQVSYWG